MPHVVLLVGLLLAAISTFANAAEPEPLRATFPNANIFQSPYTWRNEGRRPSRPPAAAISREWSRARTIRANVDTSLNAGQAADDMPTLKVTIDDQPPRFVQFPPGARQVTLATICRRQEKASLPHRGDRRQPDQARRLAGHDVSDQDRQPGVRRRRHALAAGAAGRVGHWCWATATSRLISATATSGRTTNMSTTRCRGRGPWRLPSTASLARSASARPAGFIRGRGAIRPCPTGGIITRPASRAICRCSPTMFGWRWGRTITASSRPSWPR